MPKRAKESEGKPTRAPARTLESRENQLISLAMDLAEKQLLDGTASSQIITTFVNRGSTKERIEKEILSEQKELLNARTGQIKSDQSKDELYEKVIHAMRRYSGGSQEDDYED